MSSRLIADKLFTRNPNTTDVKIQSCCTFLHFDFLVYSRPRVSSTHILYFLDKVNFDTSQNHEFGLLVLKHLVIVMAKHNGTLFTIRTRQTRAYIHHCQRISKVSTLVVNHHNIPHIFMAAAG